MQADSQQSEKFIAEVLPNAQQRRRTAQSATSACNHSWLQVAAQHILFAKFSNAGRICSTVDHA